MYQVADYKSISSCEQSPYYLSTGMGIQIFIHLLSLKWEWATSMFSFWVLLSYMNILFCYDSLMNPSNQIAVVIDTLILDIFTSYFLSINWLSTVIASIGLKCSLYYVVTY